MYELLAVLIETSKLINGWLKREKFKIAGPLGKQPTRAVMFSVIFILTSMRKDKRQW